MTYFLIFLAVMAAAGVALYVVGLRTHTPEAAVYHDGLKAPVRGLPPVLLPEELAPADVDRLRFSLGLRGYRMDQVDEVLDRLRDELAVREHRIAGLAAALKDARLAEPALADTADVGPSSVAVPVPLAAPPASKPAPGGQ